jgi:NADH:ubiquinone oxidoreductase subunit 5 (subunit L)/multisubunit Na+/H+ antiporter MnhA subunit
MPWIPHPYPLLLIHATLVSGIYLMVRQAPFMTGSDFCNFSCLTAFMAGVFGFFRQIFKRVIALKMAANLVVDES